VLLDQTKNMKIWSKKHHPYDSAPLVVIATKGSMVTVMTRNGREIVRDASWFKRCTSDALIKSPLEVEPELQSSRNETPADQHPEPVIDWERGNVDTQAVIAQGLPQTPNTSSPAVPTTQATSESTRPYAVVAGRPSRATGHAAQHRNPPSPDQTEPPQQQRRTARTTKPVERFMVKHAARGQGLR
jgi:hypothetical protein